MYLSARNEAGMSREAASMALFIGSTSLKDYEHGKTTPPPEVVMRMSQVYKKPEMTAKYCREECPIGQAYCFDILNNVDLSPVAILTKFMDEKAEIDGLLLKLMGIVLNKTCADDFTAEEMAEFKAAVLELLDLEHVIETLKLQVWRFCDVGELVREHNEKCQAQRYYVKDKEPVAQAQ